MKREHVGLSLAAAVALVLAVLWYGGYMPSFADIQRVSMDFQHRAMETPFRTAAVFFLTYTAVVALSLPLATALSLLGGFLFGSVWGTALVVTAATLGATIIFILARYFFRESFLEKFGQRLSRVMVDFETYGFRNLFFLRLTPLIPFVLINVGAALSKIKTRDYVLGTLFGIIPFAYVYVEAGNQLAHITSPRDAVPLSFIVERSILALMVLAALMLWSRHNKKHHIESTE